MQSTRRLLSRKLRPDAIFCWNDHLALAAIEVARYEFGLETGRELGIAGFGDIEQASWRSFDLTTYTMPMDVMVQEVAKILLANPQVNHAKSTLVDGEFKPRDSTQRSQRSPASRSGS